MPELGRADDVTVVVNGRQAFNEVRQSVVDGTQFNLVLMDMQMPVMDGLAATRAIREFEQSGDRRLPIIALTANAFASDLEACRAAGMDDHVAKPVSMEALLLAVDRWARLADTQVAVPADVTTSHPPARKTSFRSSAAAQTKYAVHRARTLEHVEALIRRGTFAEDELQGASELLHKLAGTAGMFGEADLGNRASKF